MLASPPKLAQSVILVNGLIPFDSGKTWLTISLARALRSYGYSVNVYKPVSGHNAWYQFNSLLTSMELGYLVCEDVIKYINSLDVRVDPRLVNPIDILLAPPDFRLFNNANTYIEYFEDLLKQVVLARITYCSTGDSRHYLITGNYGRVPPTLREWLSKLAKLVNAEEVGVDELLSIMKSDGISNELRKCLTKLREGSDVVIVESFNDAAVPYTSVLDEVNLVITVAPAYVTLLDLKSFKDAVMKSAVMYGDEGLRMYRIIGGVRRVYEDYVEPSTSYDVKPSIVKAVMTLLGLT